MFPRLQVREVKSGLAINTRQFNREQFRKLDKVLPEEVDFITGRSGTGIVTNIGQEVMV